MASKDVFQWPTRDMRDEYAKKGATPYLTGFEINNGNVFEFNVIMSNGDRSRQRDKGAIYRDKTMP